LTENSVCLVVFNATINNILAISWRSVLLVEEAGVPEWKLLTRNVSLVGVDEKLP
jgi:hypothetical protein